MTNLLVLVVDDNMVSRLLPSFILSPFRGQVQVLECETGLEALRLLETHHVSHVLLDISMPNLNGIQIAQAMRKTARSDQLQLIAYTADALANNETTLKSAGFDDVLLKPLKSHDLLAILGIERISKSPV